MTGGDSDEPPVREMIDKDDDAAPVVELDVDAAQKDPDPAIGESVLAHAA